MTTRASFDAYHGQNPHIYDMICTFAEQALAAGRTRIGIGAIFERIRWETQVVTKGDPFKINDRYQPFYARKFMEDRPQHQGFFMTRRCTVSEL